MCPVNVYRAASLNRLQFGGVANNQGNFSKTAANKMFVTQICIPTQERGNEDGGVSESVVGATFVGSPKSRCASFVAYSERIKQLKILPFFVGRDKNYKGANTAKNKIWQPHN